MKSVLPGTSLLATAHFHIMWSQVSRQDRGKVPRFFRKTYNPFHAKMFKVPRCSRNYEDCIARYRGGHQRNSAIWSALVEALQGHAWRRAQGEPSCAKWGLVNFHEWFHCNPFRPRECWRSTDVVFNSWSPMKKWEALRSLITRYTILFSSDNLSGDYGEEADHSRDWKWYQIRHGGVAWVCLSHFCILVRAEAHANGYLLVRSCTCIM